MTIPFRPVLGDTFFKMENLDKEDQVIQSTLLWRTIVHNPEVGTPSWEGDPPEGCSDPDKCQLGWGLDYKVTPITGCACGQFKYGHLGKN